MTSIPSHRLDFTKGTVTPIIEDQRTWRDILAPGLDSLSDIELAERISKYRDELLAENERLAIKCGEIEEPKVLRAGEWTATYTGPLTEKQMKSEN